MIISLHQRRHLVRAGNAHRPLLRSGDHRLGVRHRQVDLRQVARASHVVCLVTRADRYPAEEAAALIPALLEVEDQPQVVLALVDVGRTAERTPQLLRSQLQVPVLTIPYDPLRAAARPVGSRRLPTRTRLAYTRLCTALMAEAVRPDYRRLVAPRPQHQRACAGVNSLDPDLSIGPLESPARSSRMQPRPSLLRRRTPTAMSVACRSRASSRSSAPCHQ